MGSKFKGSFIHTYIVACGKFKLFLLDFPFPKLFFDESGVYREFSVSRRQDIVRNSRCSKEI